MVLSSQQSRIGATRSYMYATRRRRSSSWLIVAGAAAALALVVWLVWPSSGEGDLQAHSGPGDMLGPSPASASPSTSPQTPRHDANLLPRGETEPTPPRPDPNAITMGTRTQEQPLVEERDSAATTRTTGAEDDPARLVETTSRATETGAGDGPARSTERETTREDRTPRRDSRYDPDVLRLMTTAQSQLAANRPVEARATFNAALHHPRVGLAADEIRTAMTEINSVLVFSPTVLNDDPFVSTYTIRSGDRLSTVAGRHNVDHRFLAHVNRITNPNRINLGQTLKVVKGPFHAVIDKSDYRMDIFMGEPDSQGRRMYLRSFHVGLGEYGSTPSGAFRVRPQSKLVDPAWTNPRTGEHFKSGDPENPIGRFWIGLEGTDEQTRVLSGYGIHGTIEPESIGRQSSMGCIRMSDGDIELVFGMLAEGVSTVLVVD